MNASKQALTLTQLRRLAGAPKAWLEAIGRLRQRLTHPVRLGVRAIVIDPQGRVLLVRHTYIEGWYLPGGGVDPGETLLACLARELAEETNIEIDAPPTLHGIYLQRRGRHSNHVACFVIRSFHQTTPKAPDWEIAETGFFSLDALPAGTSKATRARLAEFSGALAPAHIW